MATNERSAGFILFHLLPGDGPVVDRTRYLVLDYGKHWDFPKGHVEPGETDEDAAKRELTEETGLKEITILPDFAHEIAYFFRHSKRGLIRKAVVFFLARSESDAVTLSHEHVGHQWLALDEAIKTVTYANARQVLRLADEFLRNQPK